MGRVIKNLNLINGRKFFNVIMFIIELSFLMEDNGIVVMAVLVIELRMLDYFKRFSSLHLKNKKLNY